MLLKLYFKCLDLLFPSIAAKQIYKFMSNPRVRKLRFESTDATEPLIFINKKFLSLDPWSTGFF